MIKRYSKDSILKAGNKSLGINLLMYLTEIASKLNKDYLSKILKYTINIKKTTPLGLFYVWKRNIDGKNRIFII